MNTYDPEFTTKEIKVEPVKQEKVSTNLWKVYMWLGIGLLISGVIALCLPDIFIAIINAGASVDSVNTAYTALLITSCVLMLPSIIMMNFKSFRPKSVLMSVFYIIYCVCMGVVLSDLFLMIFTIEEANSIKTISTAFLITSAVFLVMSLIGALTKKKNLSILWPVLACLVLGALIISLVNFFIGSSVIYWIVDFFLFAVMLLVIAIDMNRVKKLADAGGFKSENNLAIYSAYTLYVDFIYIFIRILMYLAIFAKDR